MNVRFTRGTHILAGAAIAAFFFYAAGFGLFIRLGYDDVMNINFAWQPDAATLLKALCLPFTSFYRPAGWAVYRLVFDIYGLSPMPFRILIYTLLLINLYLTYKLIADLTGSREIGAMTALLYTYHGRLSPIYLNNGTLYDVLCGTLMLSAMRCYHRLRQQDPGFNKWQWYVFLALFVCAINAKEMAGALPLMLISYEFLYGGLSPALKTLSLTRIFRSLLPAAICGAITLGVARARMGPGSVMHATAPYEMTFTLHRFLDHWCHLLTDFIYKQGRALTDVQMISIVALFLVMTAVMRNRGVTFLLLWALITPLPVIFIPFRGFFVMYVPLAGWLGVVAAVLIKGRDWMLRVLWNRPPLLPNPFEPERIVPFLFVATMLMVIPGNDIYSPRSADDPGQAVISEMTRDILTLDEPLPRGAKVLFRHDRFPPDAWGTVMICRLLYRDRSLWADRPTMMDHPPDEDTYDRVFDYVDGRLVVLKRKAGTARAQENLSRPR